METGYVAQITPFTQQTPRRSDRSSGRPHSDTCPLRLACSATAAMPATVSLALSLPMSLSTTLSMFPLSTSGLEIIMDGISFDMYCAQGRGGTYILATAATDAQRPLHLGIKASVRRRDHTYGLGGTVVGAVAALHTVRMHHTQPSPEYRMADERLFLLFLVQRQNRPRGTHLAAEGAFIETVTLVEAHDGVHHTLKPVLHNRRLKHMTRALAHTQMARRTLRMQVFEAHRSGGGHGMTAFVRPFHARHRRKRILHRLRLHLGQRRCSHGHRRKESAARLVHRLRPLLRYIRHIFCRYCSVSSRGTRHGRIGYCAVGTRIQTVEAYDTARHIDRMRLGIYA